MSTEPGQANSQQLWNTRNAASFKYDAIALTVINSIVVICLLIQVRIELIGLRIRATESRWLLHDLILWLPMLIPIAALAARRFTKKLTIGAMYQKEIMWTLWYAMSIVLFVCYMIGFIAVTGLIGP